MSDWRKRATPVEESGGWRSRAEPVRSASGKNTRTPGASETFVEQAGNMASFGYVPQMQAASKPAVYGLLNKLPDSIKRALDIPTGVEVQPGDYLQSRDKNIARMKAGEEENPNAALSGKIAGGVLSAVATPVPGLAAGGGILKTAARGGILGGIMGTAGNPGDTEGVADPLQISERVENALYGTGLGALTGGVASGLQKGSRALARSPESAKELAQAQAFKGTGAMLKDYRAADRKDQIGEIGQYILDRGLLKAGDSVDDVAAKAAAIEAESGGRLSKLYTDAKGAIQSGPLSAPAFTGFNPARDKAAILAEAEKKLGVEVDKTAALKKLSDYIDELAEQYKGRTLDPGEANRVKSALDKKVKYSRNPVLPDPSTEQAFYSGRTSVSKAIDADIDAIGNAVGDPKMLQKLKEANRDYGTSKQIGDIASDRALRDSANRMLSLTDTIAGGAAGTVGGIGSVAAGGDGGDSAKATFVAGLLGALTNKAGRKYGPGLLANSANAVSPVLRYTAAPVGRAGVATINPEVLARLIAESGTVGKFDKTAPSLREADTLISSPAQFKEKKKK